MISIGRFPTRTCQGLTRRAFLRFGAAAPLALRPGAAAAAAPGRARSAGRARSILLVWLWGGPSHLDLFDPKPRAAAEFRGPFATIATRTPGLRFTELVPQLAARNDRFALVRSNVNFDPGHREAGSIALTGAPGAAPSKVYPPNFGSIVARRRGDGDLPPFISLTRGPVRDGDGVLYGAGGGTWGQAYHPFLVGCSESGELNIPSLRLAEGLTPSRLADRKAVLQELDRARRAADARAGLDPGSRRDWDELHQRAHALLSSPATHAALDLSREPESVREAYGRTSFGQSCLLGRRLVEAGVPYVQVNWSQYVEVFYPFSDYGWDTHADNFGLIADWHGPLLDRVLSVLLDDLTRRGLMESTLLVCMGEFGRTPRINAIGSRDHWPQCYFSIWAGAGVQAGRVVGESDARGEHPVTDPVTPAMVGATILDRAGISSAERAELQVLPGARVIDELF
jgi:uncharacterized protein (DUF1501 family)